MRVLFLVIFSPIFALKYDKENDLPFPRKTTKVTPNTPTSTSIGVTIQSTSISTISSSQANTKVTQLIISGSAASSTFEESARNKTTTPLATTSYSSTTVTPEPTYRPSLKCWFGYKVPPGEFPAIVSCASNVTQCYRQKQLPYNNYTYNYDCDFFGICNNFPNNCNDELCCCGSNLCNTPPTQSTVITESTTSGLITTPLPNLLCYGDQNLPGTNFPVTVNICAINVTNCFRQRLGKIDAYDYGCDSTGNICYNFPYSCTDELCCCNSNQCNTNLDPETPYSNKTTEGTTTPQRMPATTTQSLSNLTCYSGVGKFPNFTMTCAMGITQCFRKYTSLSYIYGCDESGQCSGSEDICISSPHKCCCGFNMCNSLQAPSDWSTTSSPSTTTSDWPKTTQAPTTSDFSTTSQPMLNTSTITSSSTLNGLAISILPFILVILLF